MILKFNLSNVHPCNKHLNHFSVNCIMQRACQVKHFSIIPVGGNFMIKCAYVLICFLLSTTLHAQLCQGSLGDPIVNTTFGSGTNPGPPLAAATTGYQFIFTDCPNDGNYTVRNSTSACFGSTWHSLSADHTGNPNGYFMLVNASVQPSAFYVDTVKGLCGNTTYEFAAWIMNVIVPTACGGFSNQPNLTFIIENANGTLLQSSNTGTIPASPFPTWRQQGFSSLRRPGYQTLFSAF